MKVLNALAGFLCLSAVFFTPSVHGAELSGAEMVQKAEMILWGKTMQGDFEMTVTTPSWERKLVLRSWMDRPRLSFIRVLGPAKERGIASLRIAKEMWNYIPKIERTVKIPPSMMLQPWFGSDFTNDDLVKEGSFVTDYTHRLQGEREANGYQAYVVELLPKPDAAVVWGKVLYSVRKTDFVPLKIEYFDERGKLIRVLDYRNLQPMGDRTIPTLWEMRPTDKEGKKTSIVVKRIVHDKPVDADIFTMRNLSRRNAGDQ
jgi:outer membrane lipoprotein-sorting protein